MSVYFFDSSAIVKRYVIEIDSPLVRSILRPSAQNLVFVARIAGAEVIAALAQKRKGKLLTDAETQKSMRRFERHFSLRYQKISISDKIVGSAMYLADKYDLRGYDAVQLAAAIELEIRLKTANSPSLIFVSFDDDLNDAARAEGLVVPSDLSGRPT